MVDQSPVGIFDRLNGIVHYNSMSVSKAKNLSASSGRPPKTPSTTLKTTAQTPVGVRRTKTTSAHSGVSVTAADMLSVSQEAVTDEGPLRLDSGEQKSSVAASSVTTVIAVIVVGVVLMIGVIVVGVGVLKAKRTRNRLLLEKRVVLPPIQRDINSYDYNPISEGEGGSAAAGRGDSSPLYMYSDDGGVPSSSSTSASAFPPRCPAARTSSSKPILNEDGPALNNIYSTIAGDYENVNPYEMIDD